MAWIKFIHVLVSVTFFGALIGSYFYVSSKSDERMREFILKNAIRIDLFVFVPSMVIAAITGTFLVVGKYYTFTTPWIVAAYTFLTVVFFLLLVSVRQKKRRELNKIFHAANILMILILAVIVHDAVMKHTLFEYYIL